MVLIHPLRTGEPIEIVLCQERHKHQRCKLISHKDTLSEETFLNEALRCIDMSCSLIEVKHIKPKTMGVPLLKDDLFHQPKSLLTVSFSFLCNDDPTKFDASMNTFPPRQQQKPDQTMFVPGFDDKMGEIRVGARISMLLMGPGENQGPIFLLALQVQDFIQVTLSGPAERKAV